MKTNMLKAIMIILFNINCITLSHAQNKQSNCIENRDYIKQNETFDVLVDVFMEDFNGNNLNSKNWDYHYPWSRIQSTSHIFVSDQTLVEVSNGTLKLYVTETPGVQYQDPIWDENLNLIGYNNYLFDYSAGVIHSKRNFKLGVYEMKYKTDPIDGAFPAFWMRDDPSEIDFLELYRDNLGTFQQTIEEASTYPRFGCLNDYGDQKCYEIANKRKSYYDFNTWVQLDVIWEASKLDYYINSELKHSIYAIIDASGKTYYNPPSGSYLFKGSFPFSDRSGFKLILNNGATNDYHQNITGLHKFEIDWIKVKKKLRCNSNITFTNLTKQNQFYDGFVLAGYIIVANGVNTTIETDEDVNLFAADYVEIGVDFTSEKGSVFEVTVQPYCDGTGKQELLTELFTEEIEIDSVSEFEYQYTFIDEHTIEITSNIKLQFLNLCSIDGICEEFNNLDKDVNPDKGYNYRFSISNASTTILCIYLISVTGEARSFKVGKFN